MIRKMEGFDGQRAIVIPRKILLDYCYNNVLISNAFVTDIGYYPKAKYHYREREQGSEQQILIYCVEGKGTVNIKDEEYLLQSGDCVLIPSKTAHSYLADSTNPWTIYWVHFNGNNSNEIINQFREKNYSYKCSVDFQESRIQLFEDIYYNLEMGYSYENLCYANLCFLHFMGSLLYGNNCNLASKKQSVDTVNTSIIFMKKNIAQMLTLEKLSASVNLSASHFSFLFRKKTGFSPIEYFNHLKVQKACQYLLFTDLRIKEISDKLGIEDPYYFSRMFSKIMGVSPDNYRTKRSS